MADSRISPQYILLSAQSSDPYSTRLIHPQNGTSVWSYKGSEYQNGIPKIFEPVGVEGHNFFATIQNQPILHFIAFSNKKRLHVKSVVPGKISHLCTDPSGCFVIAAIEEKLYVWSVTTRHLLNVFNAHFLKITSLQISNDGVYIVSGSEDGSLAVFQLKTVVGLKPPGQEAIEPFHTYTPHNAAVTDIYITSGKEPRILSVSKQQNAVLYSLSAKCALLRYIDDYPIFACTMDPAESKLFFGLNNGHVTVLSTTQRPLNPNEIYTEDTSDSPFRRLDKKHSSCITKLAVSFDGAMLVSTDCEGKYFIWNIATGSCLHEGQMKGPIITAKFVKPWPSLFDESYAPVIYDNTPFHKQISKDQLEIPTIRDKDADKKLDERMGNLLKNYLEKMIKEHHSATHVSPSEEVENEVPPQSPQPAIETTACESMEISEDDNLKIIEQLKKENEELRTANAELYNMCMNMITEDE